MFGIKKGKKRIYTKHRYRGGNAVTGGPKGKYSAKRHPRAFKRN